MKKETNLWQSNDEKLEGYQQKQFLSVVRKKKKGFFEIFLTPGTFSYHPLSLSLFIAVTLTPHTLHHMRCINIVNCDCLCYKLNL